jgi:hypothetical protein
VDVVCYPTAVFKAITLADVLVSLLISAGVTFAVRALMPEPEKAKERGDERSPTHGFGRVKNIRAEGQPIPVLYGEHLTAGTIFNEFVEVDNSTGQSAYFALIGLGHGDVQAIAGETEDTVDTAPLTSQEGTTPDTIFLQGNPLSAFHETKVWVRHGSNEQTLVPGFEKARVTYEVGVQLTSSPTGVANDRIPAAEYASDQYEDVWDEDGFAWDVPSVDVDGVEVVMHFPGGMYAVDGNGVIITTRWVLGLRYCKLDANGTPLLGPGFGGNQDDGWVRLPFNEFNLDRQNPFQLAFPVAFYDPTDHIDPIPGDAYRIQSWASAGHYLQTIATVDRTRRPDSWNPGVWGSGALAALFTCECWVAFDATTADGPFDTANINGAWDYLPIFEWSSAGGEDGVWFGFKVYANGQWNPYMQVGKWNRFHEWPDVSGLIEKTTDASDKKWHHLVWSHQRINSDTNVTRFWINGVYVGQFELNLDILVPDPANGGGTGYTRMKWGWSDKIQTADFSARVWWDEMLIADDFYGTQDVLLRYNGGDGIRHADSDPDLVGLWHVEGGITDATGFANHLQVQGTGALDAAGGKISKLVAPTRTRGQYRVQGLRVNGETIPGQGLRRQDDAEWQLAVTWLDEAFVYPGIAYTAIQVEATEQVNSSAPTTTQVVRGRKVRVWDRQSTVAPSFSRQWTQNPAWVAMDIATDEEYGGGQAFPLEQIDLDSVAALADRCDERVYDGRAQLAFYRQDYEGNANKCNSPISIDAFWSLSSGSPTVTQNTAEAPNGAVEADTIEDTNAGVTALRGFQVTPSTEPSKYAASAFVKKDTTATGYSSGIRLILNAVTYDAVFNLDDGAAIANCVVEDYDDNWWYVKVTPQLFEGIGTITAEYLPAAFTKGTDTEDATLTGEMTAWGFSIHRGTAHTAYPAIQGARAYLFLASEDGSGDAQTLPSQWVAGYELRLRNCGDATWNTPGSVTKALEIVEVIQTEIMDGYDRVWQIVVSWPSDLDAPDGRYPDLVSDGRDWNDIAGEWTTATGVTATAEFDDGAQTGGPDDPTPRFSTTCKVAGATAVTDPIEQGLPATIGATETIRARAHIYKPDTGTNPQLKLDDNGGSTIVVDPPLVGWNKVEVDLADAGNTARIGIGMGAAASDFWWDGVGCWVQLDSDGNTPGGTVEGAEALFQYDAVHDTFRGLWDTLVNTLLTCRAAPVREGSKLRFKYEADRAPVALVTMGNVVNDGEDSSFSVRYVNEKQRPNSLMIDFQDRTMRWERSTVSVDEPALETNIDEGLIRKESYFLLGVTRRSQVLRHASFHLAVNRTIIREGSFVSDPTGLTYEPGDVIALGHDIVPWGQGGRVIRSAGQGVNVVQNAEDFSLWTSPTGEIEFTPNSMSTPDGRPVADLIETLVATQTEVTQDIAGITSGVSYVFSFRAKRQVGSKIGIALIQSSGDTIVAEYDWTLRTLTQVTSVTGVTLTLEEESDGWVRIGVDIASQNTNDITVKILPERNPSVLLGTKVWLADAQVERGATEPTAYDRPGIGLWIDRDVTLATGQSYLCRVVSATTGVTDEGEITSGPGTYEVGERVEYLASTLSFSPQEGDVYLIYTEAERMLALVTTVRLREDLGVEVDWVQYDSSIFDGDDLHESELLAETFYPGGDGSNEANQDHATIIPEPPERITVVETGTVGPSGMPVSMLDVAWQHSAASARDVMEHRIYVSYLDTDAGVWTQPRQIGMSGGSATSAQVLLPAYVRGRLCWVMVQAVSYGGARRAPRQCDGQVVELTGLLPQPDPPTNFVAHMEGDKAVFKWDAPDEGAAGLIYEIRHGGPSPKGGWVLGVVVVETRETQFGPTEWWATAATSNATYYIRARNRQGVYSDAVAVQYGARVLNATELNSSNHWWAYVSQAWHNYGDGWKTDSASPTYDPVLSNLQRHADGYLEFSGSALSGTYVTAGVPDGSAPEHFEREEPIRLEAVLVATCLNPKEVGESNVNADGTTRSVQEARKLQVGYAFNGNETCEGNLQEALPTVRVQMKLLRDDLTSAGAVPFVSQDTDSGGSTGWMDYRPGQYVCHGARFRLKVTRPSTDWNIRVWEFTVRAYRVLPERHYRSPAEQRFAKEIGLG